MNIMGLVLSQLSFIECVYALVVCCVYESCWNEEKYKCYGSIWRRDKKSKDITKKTVLYCFHSKPTQVSISRHAVKDR